MTKNEVLKDMEDKFNKYSFANEPYLTTTVIGGIDIKVSPKLIIQTILGLVINANENINEEITVSEFLYVYNSVIDKVRDFHNRYLNKIEKLDSIETDFFRIYDKQIELLEWIKRETLHNIVFELPLEDIKFIYMDKADFYRSFLTYYRIRKVMHKFFISNSSIESVLDEESYFLETNNIKDIVNIEHEFNHIIELICTSDIGINNHKLKYYKMKRDLKKIYDDVQYYNRGKRTEGYVEERNTYDNNK